MVMSDYYEMKIADLEDENVEQFLEITRLKVKLIEASTLVEFSYARLVLIHKENKNLDYQHSAKKFVAYVKATI